jgi:hypothetical protein
MIYLLCSGCDSLSPSVDDSNRQIRFGGVSLDGLQFVIDYGTSVSLIAKSQLKSFVHPPVYDGNA